MQEDIADTQAEHTLEATEDVLNKMEDAYHDEKDKEIAILEDSISSYQKLYDMAIEYIENHWDTLYNELIDLNYSVGQSLNSEITTAWENCLAAAQRYGNYVSALNSIDNDIAASASSSSSNSGGPTNNKVVGTTDNHSASSTEDSIHAIIKEMYSNSQQWVAADSSRRVVLDQRNFQLGSMLSQYGINATRGSDGAWYVNGSELLYDKYRKYIYHEGGIAGDTPTLKQNEIMAVLEKGEAVLDKKREEGLYRLVEFASKLAERSDKLTTLFSSVGVNSISGGAMSGVADAAGSVPSNISNQEIRIEFNGDTYITGTNEETVRKHQEISRQQANEVLKHLNIHKQNLF